jgi:hypothetical protein
MKIESEKLLEKKIGLEVKKVGGISLKIPAIHHAGIPDRLCLFPVGRAVFVEVKTTKKKPTRLQLLVHKKLERIGFPVKIIDTTEGIKQLIDENTNID